MKYATSSGMAERARAALAVALTLVAAVPAGAQSTAPLPIDAAAQPLLGQWRITGIAGRPVVRGSGARLALADVRISGNTGCNTLGGNFRVERGHLTTGGLITSRRGCSPQLMRQEKVLLDLLDQRLAVRQSHRGRLILTARDGRTLVLVRAT